MYNMAEVSSTTEIECHTSLIDPAIRFSRLGAKIASESPHILHCISIYLALLLS